MPGLKLKKGDIPFAEIYKFSKEFYYKQYDNKSKRMKMDVTSARLIKTNNFDYDPKVKAWKQNAEGIRHIKFEFIVSSSPISYKKGDTINVHKYPVTFVFFNLDMGWNSPFRWRTGSFKKVRFANKGASKEQRLLIANANIKNGKQLDFFFKLEALLSWYGLLYGPDTTNRRLPVKANPDLIPFFDKTSLYIVENVLRHLLSKKGIVKIKEKIK